MTLVADGETRQVYTHAVNEKALMRENNIDIGDYDEIDVSTQKLDDGSYVKVRRAIPVTLEYRGQTQEVYTAKHNSQEVAEQYGIIRKSIALMATSRNRSRRGSTSSSATYRARPSRKMKSCPMPSKASLMKPWARAKRKSSRKAERPQAGQAEHRQRRRPGRRQGNAVDGAHFGNAASGPQSRH